MKININLSIDTMEKNILMDALELYKEYLEKESGKTMHIEASRRLFEIQQRTDEMHQQIKQF